MRKLILALIILGILALGYWLVSPLFVDKKVSESAPEPAVVEERKVEPTKENAAETTSERKGSFVGLGGHEAQGTVTLLESDGKKFIRFEDNFQVTNGPDLFVHLGTENQYDSEAVLGPLKGNIGSQNYEIPENLDVSRYDEVWVWCRAFSVPFGKANLF